MLAQRASKAGWVGVVAVLLVLGAPGAATAAAPVCAADPALYQLPAGLTWDHPRAPCTDADGDAIAIKLVKKPAFGTLAAADPNASLETGVDIEARLTYTANADAAGNRDTMTFVAVANGEQSNEFQVDVWILPAHSAPACKDLAVTVRAGSSVAIAPSCVDADGDSFTMDVTAAPSHGTYDPARRTYTAAPRYAGPDSMTYVAVDEWRQRSEARKVAITVVSPPGQSANTSDTTAPNLQLQLRTKSRLRLRAALRRGIRLKTTASERGRVVIEALVAEKVATDLGIERRVGSLSRDIAAGKSTFKLRLYRSARAALADLRRVRLRLIARMVDAAGNVRTERLRITLARR